jgi:hypothetical protein
MMETPLPSMFTAGAGVVESLTEARGEVDDVPAGEPVAPGMGGRCDTYAGTLTRVMPGTAATFGRKAGAIQPSTTQNAPILTDELTANPADVSSDVGAGIAQSKKASACTRPLAS